MNKIAFVLGNGRSRLGIDLTGLRDLGRVYGCNALYRDHAPDVLIATDDGISQEIQDSGYSLDHVFYTRRPRPDSGARKIEHFWGYSSGPIALAYACAEGAGEIYLLGFDLDGISGKFNNIYADTQHYKKSNSAPTHYGNWVNQIAEIVSLYPDRYFFRVFDANSLLPLQWTQLKNLRNITQEEFLAAINNQ